MKSISDIPCKNCITFAICNGQITNDLPWWDIVFKLIPKCSLIEDYTKSHDEYKASFSLKMLLQIAKFFKPNKRI